MAMNRHVDKSGRNLVARLWYPKVRSVL